MKHLKKIVLSGLQRKYRASAAMPHCPANGTSVQIGFPVNDAERQKQTAPAVPELFFIAVCPVP
ncbi:MAG: hypothetical protein IJL62_03985 [Clostridia bacterium]|nr:hypothetical protein [Clostridia bacterium]